MFGRHGEPEDAEVGEFPENLEGNQFVTKMPGVRSGPDALVGIAAELVADHDKVAFESGVGDTPFAEEEGEPGEALLRRSAVDQIRHVVGPQGMGDRRC